MFTEVELDYLKCLIDVYYREGYEYYVARTVTQTDNDYDFYLYVSKEKITATSSSSFILPEGTLLIKVDSSSRADGYYSSLGSRDVLSAYEGTINIDVAEFIYTNAEIGYSLIADVANPDLFYIENSEVSTDFVFYGIVFCICIFFIYYIIRDFLYKK